MWCSWQWDDDDDVDDGGGAVHRPMIIEVPHFASLRGDEREIAVLRSDDGQSWREHVAPASEDTVHEMLEGHFEGTFSSSSDERIQIMIWLKSWLNRMWWSDLTTEDLIWKHVIWFVIWTNHKFL